MWGPDMENSSEKIIKDKGIEIEKHLINLSKLGERNGVLWNCVYSEQEKKVKKYLRELVEAQGLKFFEDGVGNIFAKTSFDNKGKTILVGSHIDSVKNAGKYDGMLGVLCGIYALSYLYKNYGKPKKNVEAVGLIEEEGSRFQAAYYGSKIITGLIKETELKDKDDDGISFIEAMKEYGYSENGIEKSMRDDIEEYYELHIEQGPVLEHEGYKIGTVSNIAGVAIVKVKIFGRQDHAGTTPMDMRQDALVEASRLIDEINRIPKRISKYATATVGCIDILPGSSNVVPDYAAFTVDIRDIDSKNITAMIEYISGKVKYINGRGFRSCIEIVSNDSPVELDAKLINEIENILDENRIKYKKMISGAGHDAQIFALKVPAAMIFIPCKDGKSHTPDEYTSSDDIEKGLEVLIKVLKEKAW